MRNIVIAFICLLLAVPCAVATITVDDDGCLLNGTDGREVKKILDFKPDF